MHEPKVLVFLATFEVGMVAEPGFEHPLMPGRIRRGKEIHGHTG